MADPDFPGDYGSSPGASYTYPDIDETIQYPWRENDTLTSQHNHAGTAIDPRLYQGLFSQNAPADTTQEDYPAGEDGDVYEDLQEGRRDRYADGMDDDESDYELSEPGSGSRYEFLRNFLSSPFLD